MELTVDQALQQGVAAHREGKLQEAERLYRAILQVQPNHPDANHNLGGLAVAVGKPVDAIPLFKLALEVNPKIEQYWLSYIGLLMKLERFDEAVRALVEGEKSGVSSDRLDAVKQGLQRSVPNRRNRTIKNPLSEVKKTKDDSSSAAPSQEQITRLLEHYQVGRLEQAESLATSFTQQFPKHALGWKVLGAVFQQSDRLNESLAPMQSAVKLSPQDAEAHYNLGVTLREVGRLDESETSYKRAIALKPGYAQAHSNLGVVLQELRRLDEAETSSRQAIALKPDYAKAHNNLGVTLKEAGRLDESEISYKRAIALKPGYAEAHSNLGNVLNALGRLDEAKASYKQAIALKPEDSSTKYLLDALSGNTMTCAPLDYVEGLFDNYASKFEQSLVDNLEYRIPKLIAEIILKDCNVDSLGSIIDLGCGTGLLGAEIKRFCRHLKGLDLSQKMLDEAEKKTIYDELFKQDILGYLAGADLNFDYFIATDVFVYIGDLSDVFYLIKSRNKTSGKLVFSTENYDGEGFFLEQSGRYSHSKMYIEGLCEKFGYKLRHFETQPLRKEENRYISGGLYMLDF